MSRRGWRAFALALLAVGTAGAPAVAGPEATRQFTDPQGDAIDARGDVVSWRIRHGARRVELRATTRQGADPLRAAAWSGTNTALVWNLDTRVARQGPEYRVTFRTDSIPGYRPYVVAIVRNLETGTIGAGCAGTTLEDDTAGWWQYPKTYVVSFPRRCLGNPAQVRGWLTMTWDPRPRGGTMGVDRAPRGGSTPWVGVA